MLKSMPLNTHNQLVEAEDAYWGAAQWYKMAIDKTNTPALKKMYTERSERFKQVWEDIEGYNDFVIAQMK